jgi:secreted PhoX family phosphatase
MNPHDPTRPDDGPPRPARRPERAPRAERTDPVDPARRRILVASAAAGAAACVAVPPSGDALAQPMPPVTPTLLGFDPVAPNLEPAVDACLVPSGHGARVLVAWGDPVSDGPQYDPTRPQTAAAQSRQFGMHVGGVDFFPFVGRSGPSSTRGLLAATHAGIDPALLWHAAAEAAPGVPSAERVQVALAALGVSVMEIAATADGWTVVRPSGFARRITGATPCRLGGPAAGDAALRTAADPTGTLVTGTFGTATAGPTPWNTLLACEDRFADVFGSTAGFVPTAAERRYGLSAAGAGWRWHEVEPRFDLSRHRNEPNRFGWVVEIDPFDPAARPVKRTALGRRRHGSATVVVGPDRRIAVYSGDPERNDYLWKFVAARPFDPVDRAANRDLLDEGTLYVARFAADGTGTWLPLVHGQGRLTAQNGFASQADVLIRARQAADLLDATELDGAAGVAAHPTTRDMVVALTRNERRGTVPAAPNAPAGTTAAGSARPPVDAANPRPNNVHGHLLRWREEGGRPDATTFAWDVLMLAGDRGAGDPSLRGNIVGDDFGAPETVGFDCRGLLWILTAHAGETAAETARFGTNALLVTDAASPTVCRFLAAPPGARLGGIGGTPDGRTLFVAIRQPGEGWTGAYTQRSAWPDNGANGATSLSGAVPVKPRSAIVVVTRDDGAGLCVV